MKIKKVGFFKRFIAYLIDLMVLGILVTVIAFVIPQDTKSIDNLSKEFNIIQGELLTEEISIDSYINKAATLIQALDRKGIFTNIINCIVIILLFVVLPILTKGKTIGNIITKTKIIRMDEDEVTVNDLIYRSLLINFLGYLIITLSLVYILPNLSYFLIWVILMFLEFLLALINVFMITYKYDKMSLHDILTRTRIVSI